MTVGIADLKVGRADDPNPRIATYALGSCLGVVLWDPAVRVGGMLHVMLPTHTIDPERARTNPERFVDTGVPLLFHRCYALGARKDRIVVRVAGGASMSLNDGRDRFQTGKRNLLALKQILWKNGVFLESSDVGGSRSRTLFFDLGTGELSVKTDGSTYTL